MAILIVKELSLSAWGAQLLDRISFSLEAGELLAIIGPNGAGKTSLINTLVNTVHHQQQLSGEIDVCGRSASQWSLQERAKHVALLPQLSPLSFPYLVEEVVQLSRIPHATSQNINRNIIQQALAAMDIEHLSQRLYTQLSGGEKQRVQLARVMAQIWREEDANPRLLLLDEPSSSLDLGHQQLLMQVIRQFANQGVATIIVAHDINLVSQYADRLLALSCGQLLADGPPQEVITTSLMQQLYQVEVELTSHPHTHKPIVIF